MSDPGPENPHTVSCEAWRITYWTGNTASGEAGADRAEICMPGGYPRFDFALPAERSSMAVLVQALQASFNAGKVARSAEIARLLGLSR